MSKIKNYYYNGIVQGTTSAAKGLPLPRFVTKSAYVGIGLAKLNINLKDNNSQFITIRIVLFLGILQDRLFDAPVWIMTSLKDRKNQDITSYIICAEMEQNYGINRNNISNQIFTKLLVPCASPC